MLIVMGPVLDVSTLDLFRGAFIPGAILATLYLVYTLGRCWLNPTLGPILAEEDQPETSNNYGLEVILICMGVLAICRVFGLALSGALGFIPFGGLITLIAVLLVAYRAFKHLAILRIVVPIAVTIQAAWAVLQLTNSNELGFGAFYHSMWLLFMCFTAYKSLGLYRLDTAENFHFSELWNEFFAGLMPPTIHFVRVRNTCRSSRNGCIWCNPIVYKLW